MGWTTPKTWSFAEGMTPAIFNTHIRDNLEFLKTRPHVIVTIDDTTNSATFAADSAQGTLETYGGNVLMVLMEGYSANTGTNVACAVDFAIDGVLQGDATNGNLPFNSHPTANAKYPLMPFLVTTTPPSADEHIFEVYRKTASGTLTVAGKLLVVEWF